MNKNYPEETLNGDCDDGTMPDNVDELRAAVVGRKIVSAEQKGRDFLLTLDDGRRVSLRDRDDCCAYTALNSFLLHPEAVEHVITGVGTTDGFSTWHIYAEMSDVLNLTVGWSAGNVGYYSYGFNIDVTEAGR